MSQQFNMHTGFKERVFGGHKGVLTAVRLHDRTLYTTGTHYGTTGTELKHAILPD